MTAKFDDPLAALRALHAAGDAEPPSIAAPEDGADESGAVSESQRDLKTRRRPISGASMVGQYAQRTLRLPPSYLALMREIAEKEGTSIAEAERWVVARGLQAYYSAGERPQFEPASGGRLILPWQEKEM